jgi:hypothetical protein
MARIKLKYVNGFSNRDRKSQRVRYYFRRRGMQSIPLPGIPGSEEFMAAYSMALAMIPDSAEIGASRTSPGTINALAIDYYRSQEWKDLAADTCKKRWRIIECFRAKHGDKRVALLRQEHIEKMLAAIAKPSVKRDWLKAIRGLLRNAVPTLLKVDPTEGIASIKLPKSKGITLGPMTRSSNIARIGHSARNSGWSWNSRLRPPRAKARSFALVHSTSGMAAYALSEFTAAKMSTSRFRRSCRPRATRCRNRISPTSSPRTASRAQNTVSATTSPNGRPLRAYRRVVDSTASRKAPCVV